MNLNLLITLLFGHLSISYSTQDLGSTVINYIPVPDSLKVKDALFVETKFHLYFVKCPSHANLPGILQRSLNISMFVVDVQHTVQVQDVQERIDIFG